MTTKRREAMAAAIEASSSTPEPARKDPPLAPAELMDILDIDSPKLIGELYAIAKAEVEFDERLRTRLLAKSTGLMSMVGVSLTIATGIASVELVGRVGKIPIVWVWVLAVVAAAVFLIGLASAGLVTASMGTRIYRRANERAIFNSKQVKEAAALAGDAALADHQRYLIVQLWQVRQWNIEQADAWTKDLDNAQRLYLVFLGGVGAFFLMLMAVTIICR